MRVASKSWLTLAGPSILLSQLLLTVLPSHAADADLQRGNIQPNVATASTDHRQQVAYSGKPNQQAGQASPTRGGTYRGMELQLPKMPFARSGGNARPTAPRNHAALRQRAAAGQQSQASTQTPTRFLTPPTAYAAASADSISQASQVMPGTPRIGQVPTRNPAAGRRTASLLPASIPSNSANRTPAIEGPSTTAQRPNTGTMTTSGPPAVEPHATTAATPDSPADRLILQAHELSRGAKTSDDFTRLIETCRRTRASQPSAAASKYANELAAWAFNRRGQIKADAGQIKEAMLDFDDAVRADPNCWRAIHNGGVIAAQSGQFEQAFDAFNRTIQVNAEFAKAYSNRAALFVVAGDLLPALQDYQRAIELDPNLAVAHRGRGRVCHLLGRLDEAIGHYDAAVQLASDDAYAMASRADLLTDLGRYADALADYEHSIEIDPSTPHAYRGLAWLMATCPDESVRNPSRAIELAEFAMQLNGEKDSVSFDTLAAAQASAGDFPTAMTTLHQAIEIAPEDERTVYQDRLLMYQRARPFRITTVLPVAQASYRTASQ